MKTFLITLVMAISINAGAQSMDPVKTVTALIIATDERNWDEVENIFSEQVILDYSSMNGNPAATLSPKEITTAWKSILPGFQSTHHQLGNFEAEIEGNTAKVFCYGTATHFLEDEGGNVWTVVGTYDFELESTKENTWRISVMKFNFKYQDGNLGLPQKAIENSK